MSRPRAYQRNAADPKQGHEAGRRAKDRRVREVNDLVAVLATDTGRRVLLRVLVQCGLRRSVLSDNTTLMAAAAGQQDVGHYFRDRIVEADPHAYLGMLTDEQAARDRENRETAAGDLEKPDAD